MKIVHITDSMEMGGAEKLISLLCRAQRRRGHDPSVHCLYRVGVLGEQLRAEGFTVTSCEAETTAGRCRNVYRQLQQCRPDVAHCHNATATILGAIPARLAGAKCVIATRHGLVSPPYRMQLELKFALASRCCDAIVAVCEQTRHNLLGAPLASRSKIVRVYNAIEALRFDGAPSPEKSGFTLLHIARLSPPKDQETLVRAFALARAGNPDLHLWIVGDGPLRSKIESLVKELGLGRSLTLFGEQAYVAPFFAAADLFVMSSITEGLPLSLLEAMSAGLPAVVTDIGGMAEVARLSEAVTVAPPSDPEALANAIRRVVQSRRDLPRLRDAARRCYAANFTMERMVNDYMCLYEGSSLPSKGFGVHRLTPAENALTKTTAS